MAFVYVEAMADFLSAHAAAMPEKVALVDDRPDGTIHKLTFAELNARANQVANVLLGLGIHPGESKLVWCGQNSIGVVEAISAARKLGITSVPLNYRLSDEEAAYVTDHSDATAVIVDSEFAAMFERVRGDLPKVQHYLVFDGEAPEGLSLIHI